MAAVAMVELSKIPHNGNRTPAATGTSMALYTKAKTHVVISCPLWHEHIKSHNSIFPTPTISPMNWLRVLGRTESPQIDQRVGHEFHTVMPTLLVLKPQQQPLEFIFPRKRPLHSVP